MLNFIAAGLLIAVIVTLIKVFTCKSFYEKLFGIYFASSNLITLIIVKVVSDLNSVLDMITTLFLLQIAIILFLLSNHKKS